MGNFVLTKLHLCAVSSTHIPHTNNSMMRPPPGAASSYSGPPTPVAPTASVWRSQSSEADLGDNQEERGNSGSWRKLADKKYWTSHFFILCTFPTTLCIRLSSYWALQFIFYHLFWGKNWQCLFVSFNISLKNPGVLEYWHVLRFLCKAQYFSKLTMPFCLI